MKIKPTKSLIIKSGIALGLGLLFIVSMSHMRNLAAQIPGTVLDLKIGFSQTDIISFVNSLSGKGLESYQTFRTFDTIYPLIYTTFYGFLLFELSKAININRLIMLLPICGLFFDYSENIIINMFIGHQLEITAATATLLGAVTITKFILAYASLTVIFTLGCVEVFRLKRQ